MEFVSQSGIKFRWWFNSGEVLKARSWIYDQRYHYDMWIRSPDGSEWHSDSGLLGVDVNRGHRLVFAWCALNDSDTGTLVGVKNVTTGEFRVRSDRLATSFGLHKYGRWCAAFAALLCLCIWQFGFIQHLPEVVTEHPILSALYVILGSGFVGFIASCLQDPDPNREIDRAVSVGVEAMSAAFRLYGEQGSPDRPRRRRGRRRARNYEDESAT